MGDDKALYSEALRDWRRDAAGDRGAEARWAFAELSLPVIAAHFRREARERGLVAATQNAHERMVGAGFTDREATDLLARAFLAVSG